MRTILFQGDSITDAERQQELQQQVNDRRALGSGYPGLIAARILNDYPQAAYRFSNRGISGNRIIDLQARWIPDCIQLEPDTLSILIGVNDTWHQFSRGTGVSVDRYHAVYHQLLLETKAQLPTVQLILCEPFVLPCGVVTADWLPEMARRQEIVKLLSLKFSTIFVPIQSVLDAALTLAPAEYWLGDGVHPTLAGHQLLADTWLKAVDQIGN